MKIALIGATGFIGRHVTASLARRGHQLLVFHRGTQIIKDVPHVATVIGERKDLSSFSAAFSRFDPEVVVDMIGYSHRDARQLVDTFKHGVARVVALSSVDVYRNRTGFFGLPDVPPDPLPLREDSPLRTRFYPYADHARPFDPETTYEKINVEQTLRTGFPGRVTILRLAAIYGPGDHQHRLWPYLKRMLDHRPFLLVERTQARWRWTRGYVENVAAAIATAATAEGSRDEIYNLGEVDTPTEEEWIARIAQVTGWSGRIIPLPNAALPGSLQTTFDWNYGFAMDCHKIRSVPDFTEPVARELAMHRTVEWETAHPPAPDAGQFGYAAEDAAAREYL